MPGTPPNNMHLTNGAVATPGLRRLGVAFVAVVVLFGGDAPGRCDSALDEVVGTWRGRSVCVDREAAPACSDEQVVYEISATPDKANSVTVKADKVVEGKRVPMGAFDFTWDTKEGGWMTELETPRIHAICRLAVSGTRMQGSMTLVPSKAVVRRMDLRKDK